MHFFGKQCEQLPKNVKNCQNAKNVIFLLWRALPQAPFPQHKCTFLVKKVTRIQKNDKTCQNAKNVIFLLWRALPQAPFPSKMHFFSEHRYKIPQHYKKLSNCLKCSRRALPQAPFLRQKCTFLMKVDKKYQKITKIVKMLKMLYFFSGGHCRRRLFPSKNALFL